MKRRDILAGLGGAVVAAPSVGAADKPVWLSPQLPDGTREEARLGTLPGKQPLIRLADRPPNYEAPIETFRSAITPDDRFFVRYHLAGIPGMGELGKWSLSVGGDAAERSMMLGMADLHALPQAQVTAVCQCSGSRRGLSQPHVAGVQWGYGAMGNATWSGPRLKEVLAKAGVRQGAVEVWLGGADGPVVPTTPDFMKALPLDKAMADEVIIATAMNGKPLPHLNGYPARVIVPGWTATYWMKHVNNIQLSSRRLDSYWMKAAYRVPADMFPVDAPFPTQDNAQTWPITEMVVNSLVADPIAGTRLPASGFTIEGVAWDRGHGIGQVEVSLDGGKSWKDATLGKDLGRFSFRAFSLATGRLAPGNYILSSRATSNAGETQADKLKFNPAGYQNNVPQQIAVTVA
jgi:DMSO/TMAO reductase YedYZ molybdopterin-dependent catalytic subunit